MSPRSIRRAAERKQQKLARKEARQLEQLATFAPQAIDEGPVAPPKPVSQLKLAANRANAQLSTGPTSNAGLAKSCLNAVKTGLTGRTVLLPTDDSAAYEQHLRNFQDDFKPATPRESALVKSLADTAWRLDRIPGLEFAIFARGRIEFAEQFKDHDPDLRSPLLELEIFLAYEKQLRNLQIQEARLHRRREKDMAELRGLQDQRERLQQSEARAAKLRSTARLGNTPVPAPELGFEFSTAAAAALGEQVMAENQAHRLPGIDQVMPQHPMARSRYEAAGDSSAAPLA